MIHLHYSNRLEELIAPLVAELSAQQRRDPLERAVVIVPNRIVEEFLKLRIAELAGVAANIEFPFLRRYLARAAACAEPDVRVLDADELQLVIFECLRAGIDTAPELGAVRQYVLAGSQRPADRELRLFTLSVAVARLLREYAISRRSVLARWRDGPAQELDGLRETERWQRRVYLSLFGPGDCLRPEWIAGEPLRGLLLPFALGAIAPEKLKPVLANPLHMFGLSYVGAEFVRIFAQLGELTELHLYTLNPCLEFWEDVDSGYTVARDRWVHRRHKIGQELEAAEDPFNLDAPGDNAALRLWGKPGREYVRLLNELTDCDFDSHFKHPIIAGQPVTLLAHLQERILCREPEPAHPPGDISADDSSIRFAACPGIRREVEVAANSIWSLIRNDRGGGCAKPLRFHHIALVIPDAQLDAYLPHVETVFTQLHEIPLDIVDRRFTAENRVIEAVQWLLQLPLGQFARDDMLHLLTHEAIAPVGAGEQWQQWCESLGVFFGADERDLAGTYIPADNYHWDQALRRLALGVFMAGEPSGETQAYCGPDGRKYLPLETAQDDLNSVATLIQTARRLVADGLDLRARELPIVDWAPLIANLVSAYVKPLDAAGQLICDRCIAAIQAMAYPELRGGPVCYQVACELALAQIAGIVSDQGRYAEGGVAVGSFSALSSIPFRVIFALGLAETIFPQPERRDLLDLRLARRRAGDVTANQRDRYLFLETLLAAREQIVLSYVARDELTGQRLEPSPLIRELRFILRAYLGDDRLDRLTVHHPLSRYSREYFPDLPGAPQARGLESFDTDARRGARMAALRDDLIARCGAPAQRDDPLIDALAPQARATLGRALRLIEPPTAAAGPEQPSELILTLGALRRFLECPLQGSARYALRMLDDDDEDGEDSENEPIVQPFLDRLLLCRDALWLGRGDDLLAKREYEQALRHYQLRGSAPVGPFGYAAQHEGEVKLGLCIEQLLTVAKEGLAGWRRIRIGGAEELAETDLPLDPIELKLLLPAGDGQNSQHSVKLHGTITVSPQRDRSIRCIIGKEAKPKDFIEGFLAAIALAASGEINVNWFTAMALGGREDSVRSERFTRSLRVLSQQAARDYLTLLVEDLFSGENNYFLPIEAIEKVVRLKSPKPHLITDAIEEVRDDDWSTCRSDYGPLRNARSFHAPQPSEVLEIITRRFGPIITIFGEAGIHWLSASIAGRRS